MRKKIADLIAEACAAKIAERIDHALYKDYIKVVKENTALREMAKARLLQEKQD